MTRTALTIACPAYETPAALAALKERLNYDRETGRFTWRTSPTGRVKVGAIAGSVTRNGYRYVYLHDHYHYCHRLAWAYVHGEWPASGIDHVDLDKTNNAIANLRLASQAQNNSNVAPRNKTGLKGICFVQNRWRAQIKHQGRRIYLGSFSDPQSAHAAYVAAAKRYHGEFARF